MSTERQEPGEVPRVGALDLPAGSSPMLATLLRAAAGPADQAELAGEAAAMATFVREIGEDPTLEPPTSASRADEPLRARPRMRRPRMSVRSVRTVAAAAVISIVFGGGLAAADVLPAPAQRWVSRALDAVGINVPSPDNPRSASAVVPNLAPADVEITTAGATPRGAGGPGSPADHASEPAPAPTSPSPGAPEPASPGASSSLSGSSRSTASSRGTQAGTSAKNSNSNNSNSNNSGNGASANSSSGNNGSGKAGSGASGSTGGASSGGSGNAEPGHGRKNGATKPTTPAASHAASPSLPAAAVAHRPRQSPGHSSAGSGNPTK